MGLMVIAGWECCDKWEGWSYNEDADGEPWDDEDYQTANAAMLHEAAMMQSHPSMLAFLVGSDYWPDDRATRIYVDALNRMDWNNPIVSSASKRGFPRLLGPSGMEMDGPYDWVPPNYWYGDRLGAAQGFSSELGAGVGTPELRSLKKFLSEEDLRDLWTQPDKDLFHMSRNGSQFASRSIYNAALRARYGEPKSLNDYLLKTGLMDFEATRAQFESYGVRKSSNPPATGL
jgi:exo-1,4-beta-D-glucosaminidase